jgi:hypothetical protein
MKTRATTAFVLISFAVAPPAWAQTPDDNPVINAYRQQGGGGTPTDNFMYNSYQRYGPGTPDDNFMQNMMSPPRQHQQYGLGTPDDNMMPQRTNGGIYQDDQDDDR